MRALCMTLWGLLTFLLVEVLVFLPLYLLGIPAAWLASRYAKTVIRPSVVYPRNRVAYYVNPILDWWLGNWEDGICPEWWASLDGTPFTWFLRNPVTNLRFARILGTRPDPARIRYVGSSRMPEEGRAGWFICWQGPYVGMLWQNTQWGVWLGWKVKPEDRLGVHADCYRYYGVGIAAQLMRF